MCETSHQVIHTTTDTEREETRR
ncbi:hypothetical protein Taro_030928 [Colocasia esculenta]|uniref:Uncharacterized protein n=1 Tax=Colocasia esculenta TaxID=4460 RepID=A0A843VHK9_COLES|nr:hypothetical protein [Colocasia esculenta]